MIQTGFFTHEIQLRRLDQLGDSLKEVGEAIDFEMFRPSLASLLGVHTGVVGRKPLDQVFMFKILVLQVIRGLSDEALEFHLNDSASAQRFIGRSPHDTMPDSTSIWLFRDKLAAARVTRSDDGTGSPPKRSTACVRCSMFSTSNSPTKACCAGKARPWTP
jgi:hypothetical protein